MGLLPSPETCDLKEHQGVTQRRGNSISHLGVIRFLSAQRRKAGFSTRRRSEASNQEGETEYLRPVQQKGGNPLLHAIPLYINRRSMAWPGSTVMDQPHDLAGNIYSASVCEAGGDTPRKDWSFQRDPYDHVSTDDRDLSQVSYLMTSS